MAEAKNENLVVGAVTVAEPFVGALDVLLQPVAQGPVDQLLQLAAFRADAGMVIFFLHDARAVDIRQRIVNLSDIGRTRQSVIAFVCSVPGPVTAGNDVRHKSSPRKSDLTVEPASNIAITMCALNDFDKRHQRCAAGLRIRVNEGCE